MKSMVKGSPDEFCQGTLHRFHPFCLFRPLHTFITFHCLYSSSPLLNNSLSFPLISAYLRFFTFTLLFTFRHHFIHCSFIHCCLVHCSFLHCSCHVSHCSPFSL